MYITEKEIYNQYDALKLSYEYLLRKKDDILSFMNKKEYKSIVFVGCGSSYSLAKSAAKAWQTRLEIPAYAFSAGDIILHHKDYKRIFENALFVSLSRSGSTSEIIIAMEKMKEKYSPLYISISAKIDAPLSKIADLNIDIPWAFDESVCQTRCVTNLYLTSLLFAAFVSKDDILINSLKNVIENGEKFLNDNRNTLEKIGKLGWKNAVILADGEIEGIAEEGSLALTEIALLSAYHFNVLDVRHGPIVLITNETLVIAVLTSDEIEHQKNLLKDLKNHGATVLVFTDKKDGFDVEDYTITVEKQEAAVSYGIPFIYLPQAIALFKAISLGINPDEPEGLDSWIKI